MIKQSGIYMIQSISNPERIYIGSAVWIKKRWGYHLEDFYNNKHKNPKLQNHYNKYGKKDLVFSVLESCPIESLIEREQYYINTLKPWFNINKIAGSGGRLGSTQSEESRKRISDGHLGQVPWNKGKTGVYSELYIKTFKEHHGNLTRKGSTHTEESKQKMRNHIFQYDLQGNFIKEWLSTLEASIELSIGVKMIYRCLTGRRNQTHGFLWGYKLVENKKQYNG